MTKLNLRERPLFPIARKYLWTVPTVAALGFVGSALEGLSIGLVLPVLSILSGDQPSSNPTGVVGWLGSLPELFPADIRLLAVTGLMVLFVLAKAIIQIANATFANWVNQSASHDLRVALADRLLGVGYGFFLRVDPARLVNVIATESWRASDAIAALFGLAVSFGTVVVFALLMLLISWQLFIGVAVGLLAVRLVQSWVSDKAHARSEEVTRANTWLAQRITAVAIDVGKIARLFGQQERELREFEHASAGVTRAMIRAESLHASVGPASEVMHSILFAAILLVATTLGFGLPVLVTFLLLLYRMQPSVRQLSSSGVRLQTLFGAVREVEWLLDPSDKPASPSGTIAIERIKQGITFEAISYGYERAEHGETALTDVSFIIPAGSITALVGPSGSGKSTTINLLCRLIDPTAGRILVDGVDLTTIDPRSLRRRVAVAGQDVDFFEGTIRDNLVYGVPDATDEQIRRAVVEAGAHDFITALPRGYETIIGARGVGLSGGQRQRVALARALLLQPQLLILDEATNAVDQETELSIMSKLSESRGGMTILVVSHRNSALQHCTHVIEIEGGRVVEAVPSSQAGLL